MKVKDYVLAISYADGDPQDPWCVGFYMGISPNGRHYVGDVEGGPGPYGFRYSGFRNVELIDADLGKWLLDNREMLELAPPGAINLKSICQARMTYLKETTEVES